MLGLGYLPYISITYTFRFLTTILHFFLLLSPVFPIPLILRMTKEIIISHYLILLSSSIWDGILNVCRNVKRGTKQLLTLNISRSLFCFPDDVDTNNEIYCRHQQRDILSQWIWFFLDELLTFKDFWRVFRAFYSKLRQLGVHQT